MLNYIKAELYRNFNRPALWVFTAILSGSTLLLNIIFKVNHVPKMNLAALLDLTMIMMVMPVFLVITMIDMSTAEEQKNQTLKNVISFGIPRSKVVVSKLIVSIILAFISAFIIVTIFFGSAELLLGVGSVETIKNDSIRLLAAIPLWMAAISVGTFLALVFNNNTTFAFVYAGVFVATSRIIKLLAMLVSDKFNYVYNILITTQLSNLGSPKLAENTLRNAVLAGIIYTILFAVISIVYIRKKEIK